MAARGGCSLSFVFGNTAGHAPPSATATSSCIVSASSTPLRMNSYSSLCFRPIMLLWSPPSPPPAAAPAAAAAAAAPPPSCTSLIRLMLWRPSSPPPRRRPRRCCSTTTTILHVAHAIIETILAPPRLHPRRRRRRRCSSTHGSTATMCRLAHRCSYRLEGVCKIQSPKGLFSTFDGNATENLTGPKIVVSFYS